jgi:uncharacterized protein (DUF849 family)
MDRREFVGTSIATVGALSVAGTATRSSAAPKQSVEDKPVILECAINGATTKAKNPSAPDTPAEHTAEIVKCLDAGASIIHMHSNKPNEDVLKAAQSYTEVFRPVWKKHPHAILYATANFDPQLYNRERRAWPGKVQCGHQRILAQAGDVNMVLFDTGVIPFAVYDKEGVPGPDTSFFWYGFWPDDVRYIQKVCKTTGAGASISVFEPGWMKTVVAMAKAGTLPRGSKINIYFGADTYAAMAPAIPEALELYLKMMEGLDLKWAVGYIGEKSVMDTPLARMALERGGSFRVGLEDWPNAKSNLEELKRAKDMIKAVGRPIVTGAEAIKYLDIPFAATRPKD